MASGDQVVHIVSVSPPGTLFAKPDALVGGSTPAESVPLHNFDAAVIWYLDFLCYLKGYGGGGLTFTLPWSAASASSGTTRWGIAIRRIQDDLEDLTASHTYVYNDVDDVAPTVSGEVVYPTLAFTDGTDMDDWADEELAIARVRREATHVNDDMTGFAQLLGLLGKET